MARNDFFEIDYMYREAKKGKHRMGFQAVSARARSVFRQFSADEDGFFETKTDAEAEATFARLDDAGLSLRTF